MTNITKTMKSVKMRIEKNVFPYLIKNVIFTTVYWELLKMTEFYYIFIWKPVQYFSCQNKIIKTFIVIELLKPLNKLLVFENVHGIKVSKNVIFIF